MNRVPSRRGPAAVLLLAGLIAAWLAYRPALAGGFVFDDLPGIVEQPILHWQSPSWSGLLESARSGTSRARVVANLSLGLDHAAAGLEPRRFHLTNLWIHLLAGTALALTAALYTARAGGGPGDRRTALLAAALTAAVFLVHPLNSQAVSYVIQRMSSLAGLFSILAFGAYLAARPSAGGRRSGGLLALAAVLWLLAVGSKENALLLPLVAVTYEACFHRQEWRRRLTGWWRSRRSRAALGLAVAVAVAAVWGFLTSYPIWADVSLTRSLGRCECTGVERLLTESRVHLLYLSLLIWPAPSRLNLDHDIVVSRSLLDPLSTLPAVGFWVAVAAAALVLAARRPRWGFPVLAYLELHAIESGPIDLDLAFEHRMYLPTMFLALLAAAVAADSERIGRRLLPAILAVSIVPLVIATHQRNRVWADPLELHRDIAAKSPGKYRAQYNLGTLAGQAGHFSEAAVALRRAIALDPESSEAHNQLGSVLLGSGDLDAAVAEYRTAVRLDPENAEAVFNLAAALEQSGETAAAASHYRRFLEIAPPYLSHARPRARAALLRLSPPESTARPPG